MMKFRAVLLHFPQGRESSLRPSRGTFSYGFDEGFVEGRRRSFLLRHSKYEQPLCQALRLSTEDATQPWPSQPCPDDA